MLEMRHYLLISAIFGSLLLNSCSRKEPTLRTFQMGERAQVGRVIYTTLETEWLAQVGEPPQVRVPKNRFFLIRVSIANSGNSNQLAPALTLIDDGGQEYPELTDGQDIPQ